MKKSVFNNIISQKGLVDLFALLGIAIMLITLPAANKLLSERQEIRKQAQDLICPIGCCSGECGTCPSGQSCDIQNGACSSGLSCNPKGYGTHLACRDNKCVYEPGDGAPECSTNEECEQKQKVICTANECCGTGVKCNSAGTACNVTDSGCGAKQICWPKNCCKEGYKCRDDGTACDVSDSLCKSTPPPPTPTLTPTITPTPNLSLNCSGNAPNGGVFRCDNPSDTHFGTYKCYQRPDKPKPACYIEHERIPQRDTSCNGQICVRYEGWFCDDSNRPKGACDCCDAYATPTPTPLPTSTPTKAPTPTPIATLTPTPTPKFTCTGPCENSGSLNCYTGAEMNLGSHFCRLTMDKTKNACFKGYSINNDKTCEDLSKSCYCYKGWFCDGDHPDECSCCSTTQPTSTPTLTPTPLPTSTPKPTSTPIPTATPIPTSTPTPNPKCKSVIDQTISKNGDQVCGRHVTGPVGSSNTSCGIYWTCKVSGWEKNPGLSATCGKPTDFGCVNTRSTNGNSTLTGIIQGSIIANATITLVDPSGKKYTAKTDNSGNFTIDAPTDQTYTVTITAPGYKSFTFVWDPSDGKDYFSQIKLEKIESDKQGSFALEEKIEKQHLLSGWSLISLSVHPTNPLTASSLAKEINDQGGKISSISRWINSSYETYITGLDKNDFPIEIGKAYFIENEKETDFTLQGEEITQPQSLELTTGWNAVSFPKTVNCQTDSCYAQLLLNLIDVTKLNSAKTISEHNSGLWETQSKENEQYFGNNFLIKPGIGYFLKVTQPLRLIP